MRSWVLLLLLAAVLATPPRLGRAEGDPLPPSLVDLVRNSPISSVDDLKLLLQQETSEIEDEEDEHDTLPDPTHARYVRSLSEAQPAQQAVCKVRTEVMEITRSMLDRRNTNFMLWPPCVEVQRCSGCCNSRQWQCVPVVTSSRYLQVIKIQYINRKPHYEKAIISVEDHVSCRCHTASSVASISRSTSQSNPSPPPPPPQQQPPSSHHPLPPPRPAHPPSSKTHTSKADLHRHDDLKHNQQHYNSEERDPVARQWHQGSYTQLVRWSQPRVHHATMHAQPGMHQTTAGMNKSWLSEARGEHRVMGNPPQPGHGSGYDGSREEGGQPASNSDVPYPDHASRQQQLLQHQQRQYHHQSQYPQDHGYIGAQYQELTTQIRLSFLQSDSPSPFSPTQSPSFGDKSSHPPTTDQKDSVTIQKTAQVTHYKQTEGIIQKEGREESGSTNSGDSVGAELTNQGKERDSKTSSEEGRLTEEERRQKLLEIVQKEPDKPSLLNLPHFQQRPKPTTFKTALPTAAPMLATARQVPFRPASPRRRRKHRKRISKAAMRAMIM
ncbi:Platelet-derived growth factor subunit B [Oryzias melastigma]|uniref:Platelet-derived growth factor subunit B n=1 Tax=Oryzias melastigma TaxID=30732 RepID=A0A834F461_ORYME|nr:Platelet-derived growth factor subunit B [Oryzias melastigma]